MRILAISGQNIASLGAPFAIDFTTPPLAGAGLFAITGETGAGKSSILDAMCLALYGEAPRLAAGARSDKVPDASGEDISAADARAILRRGAAQGWAEVRFAGRDGQDYIARWQARRARDRVEGKLQAVSRSLARAADGQVLAAQAGTVTEMVATLTGLTYEEFRRTVLLAQGDFDAFLRADTGERAALLEKVTGTGLYRAVSIRVYERTEAARQRHATLVARAAEHALMSEADRAAHLAEQQALAAENATASARRAHLTAALARHDRHTKAQAQSAAAEAAEAAAHAARTAAGAARARLTRLDLAEPLRLPWQAAAEAARHRQAAAQDHDRARQAADASAARVTLQAEAAQNAQAALAAQEEIFKTFGPLWDRAAELDAQIASAAREAEAAQEQAQAAALVAETATQSQQALQAEAARAEAAETAAQAVLTDLAPVAPLADIWPQLRRDLDEYRRAAADRDEALSTQAAARDQIATQATEADALAQAERADAETEAGLARDASAMLAELGPLEAAHPPARAADLAALATDLAELARAARDGAEAATATAAARAAQDQAQGEATAAAAQSTAARQAQALAEARLATLSAPLAQADLALSKAAQSLRAHLVEGCPCPVCGAREHPALAETGLAELALTLRRHQEAARQEAETARGALTTAEGAAAAAEARRVQALADLDRARRSASAARQDWDAALARAQTRPLCPALPATPDAAALVAAQAAVAAEQAREASAQTRIGALRQSLHDTERQREILRRALATHRAQREALAAAQAETAQHSALAEARRAAALAQIDRLAQELAPMLQAAGESDPADAELPRRLETRVAALLSARAAQAAAAEALRALAPRLAAAEGARRAAATRADESRDACARRDAALDALQADRAGLLGGAATAQHRSRINEDRLAAKAAAEAAAALLSQLSAEAAGMQARAEETARTLTTSEATRTRAEADLATALQDTGMAAPDLAELFALPRAEIETLRARLRALDDAVTAAAAARAARAADLAALLAEGLPEDPPEVLHAGLNALEAETETRARRIGQLAADLARDDDTRSALADLARDTQTARAELEVWDAVNMAIGARSGDRFARIAQAITLDVLVDHANRHLADLNPRYRLRRGAELSLQIEDRDMGDAARATRSLSGGERFLVSLALALALSRMGGKGTFAGTLFIDEGFGALDAGSLDLAIDALEALQSQGRQVGVISHVEAMQARIPVRVAVRKEGGGRSHLRVEGPEL